MNVIVLGGGVIGVTTAWFLAKSGHTVTILDREGEPARETSFANAGQISWSYASPWASPAVPGQLLKWMFARHAPLVIRARWDPTLWRWLGRMLRECAPARYAVNKERMLRLARYSHEVLQSVRTETGIDFDSQARGTLQLFRREQSLADFANDVPVLERWEIPYRILDRAGCLAVEPGLRHATGRIAGGVHYPGDETGDCFKFTQGLMERARALGVTFHGDTRVTGFDVDSDRIAGIVSDRGTMTADAYVLAAGSYSPLLLRPLGLRLPVYPVKGYSATVTITRPDAAPLSTLTDETYKVAITRLGNRLRAAGTAELTGYDRTLTPRRCATIAYAIAQLFPQAGNLSQAAYWTGLRPMTPDNVPVVGRTRYHNLFLNTGHGTLGWTMSCGSARVLTDLVMNRKPDIDLSGLTIERFGG